MTYLSEMGLAGGTIAGSEGIQAVREMLAELATFPQLTKIEKFNLVNLPEVEIDVSKQSSVEGATLCDICLAVPGVRSWES